MNSKDQCLTNGIEVDVVLGKHCKICHIENAVSAYVSMFESTISTASTSTKDKNVNDTVLHVKSSWLVIYFKFILLFEDISTRIKQLI